MLSFKLIDSNFTLTRLQPVFLFESWKSSKWANQPKIFLEKCECNTKEIVKDC